MSEEKIITEIIDTLLEGPFGRDDDDDPYSHEGDVDRIAARKGMRPGKPEKPQTYEDWVKSQPKSKNIGIHKNKPKK